MSSTEKKWTPPKVLDVCARRTDGPHAFAIYDGEGEAITNTHRIAAFLRCAPGMYNELDNSETLFFYIRNLAKNASSDKPNLEAVCRAIEKYAQQGLDRTAALLRRARGEE